ncbi:MAG: hypothetical protein P8182_13400 [Deltaproteobacteria bacterium]
MTGLYHRTSAGGKPEELFDEKILGARSENESRARYWNPGPARVPVKGSDGSRKTGTKKRYTKCELERLLLTALGVRDVRDSEEAL